MPWSYDLVNKSFASASTATICAAGTTEYPQRKDFLETGLREFLCAVLKQTWASALQKKIRLSLFENGQSSVSVLTSYR